MGITMNPVGNYVPNKITNTNRQAKVKQNASAEINRKDIETKQEAILPEEKDFFSKLYPKNKSEIMDYHFYEKNGRLSGVKLGSLIDKRG